ncbi:MAG: branched-chain amino acid ABC transporter permease [Rhodocyclaceae bacterium]|nr:branched-chain amino acid ABC transporter permease [Rhodocyclaceae bacterium]
MTGSQRYQIQHATRSSRIGLAVVALALLVLLFAPWWAGRAELRLLIEIFCYLALASLWNLLAGYAGLVSVGQQAFVGCGGYLLFALAMFQGIPPLAAIPLAGLACAALALPAAWLLFRLRGAYFAIGSWVLAEVALLVFAQIASLGGGSGISLPVAIVRSIAAERELREMVIYWTALGVVSLILLAIVATLRSRLGLALMAIRDNETAAQASGVDAFRVRLAVYVLVAGATGMIGALTFLQKLRIAPDAAFSVNDWTAQVIFIAVIGGIGRIEGPIIGTVIFFALRELLADYGTLYLITLGAVAIAAMLFARQGVWGCIEQRCDLQLFPLKRRVVSKIP